METAYNIENYIGKHIYLESETTTWIYTITDIINPTSGKFRFEGYEVRATEFMYDEVGARFCDFRFQIRIISEEEFKEVVEIIRNTHTFVSRKKYVW